MKTAQKVGVGSLLRGSIRGIWEVIFWAGFVISGPAGCIYTKELYHTSNLGPPSDYGSSQSMITALAWLIAPIGLLFVRMLLTLVLRATQRQPLFHDALRDSPAQYASHSVRQMKETRLAAYSAFVLIALLGIGYSAYTLYIHEAFSGSINIFSVLLPKNPEPLRPAVAQEPPPAVKFLPELRDRAEMRQAIEASPDTAAAHYIQMNGAAVFATADINIGNGCILSKGERLVLNQIIARDVRAWYLQSVSINLPDKLCMNHVDRTAYIPINKIVVDKSSL
jgi:hypothetical protein